MCEFLCGISLIYRDCVMAEDLSDPLEIKNYKNKIKIKVSIQPPKKL
ncbi:hypothetical protein MSIBF_A2620008 [groundwater metagenome]|uniref:Uncharacterized protein n=1 Tax=groundwater metagenome TaxID=717931 RepID=A0A098E9J8_9ZZZZ